MKKRKRDEAREKWVKISEGKIKDDYTNHFLSHFGINDYHLYKESVVNIEQHRDIYRQ